MKPLSFLFFLAGWKQKPGLTILAWIVFAIGLFLAVSALHVHQITGIALTQLSSASPDGDSVILSPPGYGGEGFTPAQLSLIGSQAFATKVFPVQGNLFRPELFLQLGDRRYGTELFFEAVPDDFLSPKPENWRWVPGQSDPLPILIPRDFLSLYNIGFAPARHLPPLNVALLSLVPIQIRISSSQGSFQLSGRVVGVTEQITTILVPQSFMVWANASFGNGKMPSVNRVVVQVKDRNDPAISRFAEKQGFSVSSASSGLREAVAVLQAILAGLLGLAVLLLGLSLVVFFTNQGSFMHRALPDLRVLVLLGHQPRTLSFLAGTFNFIMLILMVLIVLLGADALAGRLESIFREMGLATIKHLDPSLIIMAPLIVLVMVMAYSLWYYRQLSCAEQSD